MTVFESMAVRAKVCGLFKCRKRRTAKVETFFWMFSMYIVIYGDCVGCRVKYRHERRVFCVRFLIAVSWFGGVLEERVSAHKRASRSMSTDGTDAPIPSLCPQLQLALIEKNSRRLLNSIEK